MQAPTLIYPDAFCSEASFLLNVDILSPPSSWPGWHLTGHWGKMRQTLTEVLACHCYQSCLLLECSTLPSVEGKERVPEAAPPTCPSAPHLTTHFFPHMPSVSTCHPVLLLATRGHVPAPQIVHSFIPLTLSPWGGLSLPISVNKHPLLTLVPPSGVRLTQVHPLSPGSEHGP